jgi:hypothetical protein
MYKFSCDWTKGQEFWGEDYDEVILQIELSILYQTTQIKWKERLV